MKNIFLALLTSTTYLAAQSAYQVKPITETQAREYKLDTGFYKKATVVQDILIATSARVADLTHKETAYQFDMLMRSIKPEIAEQIRKKRVLCLLIGHDELTSQLPQFTTDKKGKELDFYNWRQRGFLKHIGRRPTVLFAEEDVMEYDDGMKLESILIHEFGHVVHGAGFDKDQQERLTAAFKKSRELGIWNDGRAAQRFRRVKGEKKVSLLGALKKWFPEESPELLRKCLDEGDVLVNGKPTNAKVKVNGEDKVRIVFGGPKRCYASRNRSEYWAEGFQTWYDTNRTMDHDHNHIHTRKQLRQYDTQLSRLCYDVMGDSAWRFISPRKRASWGHLAGFDPQRTPKVEQPEHIKKAANDYYDGYWKSFWKRLALKHLPPAGAG